MSSRAVSAYKSFKEGSLGAASDMRMVLIGAMRQKDETVAQQAKTSLIERYLERPNWPPWKAFSARELEMMQRVCPEGQLSVFSDEWNALGALNMQRIQWDGVAQSVPTWSQMMLPANFASAYNPIGNTMMMLNISVNALARGANVPSRLIDLAIEAAQKSGVTRIGGLFRPNKYGEHKLSTFEQTGRADRDFEAYVSLRRDDGALVDDWLRNLQRNGMSPLGISNDTYTVSVPHEQFMVYKMVYKPQSWRQVEKDVWECDECGSWTINPKEDSATYSESRVVGIVWEAK